MADMGEYPFDGIFVKETPSFLLFEPAILGIFPKYALSF
jgi:hypothetical protein